MARKGNNIYRRKDGRWEGRYVKGRKDSRTVFGYVYGHSYTETKQKVIKARMQWEAQAQEKLMRQDSLSKISKMWIAESEAFIKESTTIKYQDYLNWYILPVFGGRQLGEIDNLAVSDFCISLLKNGGKKGAGLSAKTVSEVQRVLMYIRKYALKQGYAVGYTPDCIKIHIPKKPIRVFTQKEQTILEDYIGDQPSGDGLGVLLVMNTGLRVGEVCALKWDDFSLEDNQLYVHSTLQRIRDTSGSQQKTKIITTSPKSDYSIRVIPLPDEIMDVLRANYKPGTYFLTGDETHFMEPRLMQIHFKNMLEDCGLEVVNFHVLRHTFATRCIEVGFDVKCLSEILGHANVNITLNRYVHPTMSMKQENMAKLYSSKS